MKGGTAVVLLLTGPITWTLVRCPVCRAVLGEVGGADARLRRVCGRCSPRQVVVYDHASGVFTLEPAPAAPGAAPAPPPPLAARPATP